MKFKLQSEYQPAGDQPEAIRQLVEGVQQGIKYIDYKDASFLLMLCNEQGKILPRRLTGTSLKFQRKVAQAIKKARHLALMPYVADNLR